ncbi:NAD-dependent epimerase/dehydratase family protein [Candidatus Woesearchaeota archaeon]|nr:NAD-dependent epimerase/dehydratase family protein [Candidatus Woesearchaeota archaeon]
MYNQVVEEDIRSIGEDLKPIANKLSGKTLLITGGAGFLGNYFLLTIEHLNKNVLTEPCKVISVDNFITGMKYQIGESGNFKAIKHDIVKPLKIDEKIDYIIHAAGIGSPKFYRIYKIETIDVGVLGTRNVLEMAKEKKVKSFMFFSSSEVYGDPDPRFVPTPETYYGNVSCTGPRSNYDESKRLGETLCVAYNEMHNIPVKMVRPFNVYGPGMREDDYRVIPNFVANAFKGNPLPIYGEGHQTRTFCYITDAMIGFFKMLLSEHNKESFNVGTQEGETSMEELAGMIAEIFGNKVQVRKAPGLNDAYGKSEPKRRCPDITKIRTLLDYHPKVDLRTGLKRFIKWAAEEYSIKSEIVTEVKNSF